MGVSVELLLYLGQKGARFLPCLFVPENGNGTNFQKVVVSINSEEKQKQDY
jgi:hypothetical protein